MQGLVRRGGRSHPQQNRRRQGELCCLHPPYLDMGSLKSAASSWALVFMSACKRVGKRSRVRVCGHQRGAVGAALARAGGAFTAPWFGWSLSSLPLFFSQRHQASCTSLRCCSTRVALFSFLQCFHPTPSSPLRPALAVSTHKHKNKVVEAKDCYALRNSALLLNASRHGPWTLSLQGGTSVTTFSVRELGKGTAG